MANWKRYPLLAGLYEVDGMPVIVTRGAGTWGPRMRLFRRGEILHVTLLARPQPLVQRSLLTVESSAYPVGEGGCPRPAEPLHFGIYAVELLFSFKRLEGRTGSRGLSEMLRIPKSRLRVLT